MKYNIMISFIVFFMAFLPIGCGKSDNTIYLETATSETESVEISSTEQIQLKEEPLEKNCYVYVCGAVKCPGVYMLQGNSRVYEAIAMAGGLSADASIDAVNQAGEITDGQMIRVPTQEEVLAEGTDVPSEGGVDAKDGRINLNTASEADLMTLPGIGQSKADAIIDYREQNGKFSTTEEVMNIEGIKEGVYNRIKDHIKVK